MSVFGSPRAVGEADANYFSRQCKNGAHQAHSRKIRDTYRDRSRSESEDNPYLVGIQRTHANSVIGLGPKLQINYTRYVDKFLDGSGNRATARDKAKEVARQIESGFQDWVNARGIADKARTLEKTALRDPEAFAVILTGKRPAALDQLVNCVKREVPDLDVQLIDDERVRNDDATVLGTEIGGNNYRLGVSNKGNNLRFLGRDDEPNPNEVAIDVENIDGVLVHRGETVAYQIANEHPDAITTLQDQSFRLVPAKYVIHFFERDRQEQFRGVPVMATAMLPASWWRKFSEAIVKAAKSAASLSWIMFTDAQGETDDDVPSATPYDTVELETDTGLVLPDKWKPTQMKAEHPNATHGDFEDRMIRQMGRPIGMGIGEATGDYSKFNFSSAQMGRLIYFLHVAITQSKRELAMWDGLFCLWWDAVALLEDSGHLTTAARRLVGPNEYPPAPEHLWQWPKPEPLDEIKTATANAVKLKTAQTNLRRVLASQNIDIDDLFEEMARDYGCEVEEVQEIVKTTIHALKPAELAELLRNMEQPGDGERENEQTDGDESRPERLTRGQTVG